MGSALEGDVLEIKADGLVSFGLALACGQVPPSGQPILLMPDHQTAGGYPVVAGVARCDLPLAAQLLPGDHLRFREGTVEVAQEEWRRGRRGLEKPRWGGSGPALSGFCSPRDTTPSAGGSRSSAT